MREVLLGSEPFLSDRNAGPQAGLLFAIGKSSGPLMLPVLERLTPQIGQVPRAQGVRTFANMLTGRHDCSQDHPLSPEICIERSAEACRYRAPPRDRAV